MLEPATGRTRLLAHDEGPEWSGWSADGRTVYYFKADLLKRFSLRGAPASGGSARTVVYPNQPDRQLHHHGIAVSGGRFYFPLFEQTADVWVAEVNRQ